MGAIVGAFGTAHIMMKRGSAGDAGERVFAGMREIGRRIRALAPDLLVIVSSDHMYNYDLNVQTPFAVAVADVFTPFGDMELPATPFPGHTSFAAGFIEFAAEAGFDLARLQGYRPDHGVVIPALFASPRQTLPVVPLIVNTSMTPIPRARRSWDLGRALARYVAEVRPGGERTVIVGTGGLSHWLGVPEMGRVNEAFDTTALNAITSGRGEDLADWSTEYILENGGNGGLELLCWILMAGTVKGGTGDRVYYEAIPQWITGMGGVHIHAGS
ncbi:MAG: hypothetical protein K2P94_03920 [Rhodospirillaceae bacterium]|nr:hypothetical protein [Rhodospirillaceae bacterium]